MHDKFCSAEKESSAWSLLCYACASVCVCWWVVCVGVCMNTSCECVHVCTPNLMHTHPYTHTCNANIWCHDIENQSQSIWIMWSWGFSSNVSPSIPSPHPSPHTSPHPSPHTSSIHWEMCEGMDGEIVWWWMGTGEMWGDGWGDVWEDGWGNVWGIRGDVWGDRWGDVWGGWMGRCVRG